MNAGINDLVAPLPTIRRLPAYLRLLRNFKAHGREVISGGHIAECLKFEPIQVRKDLAWTGAVGKAGVGFEIDAVIGGIEKLLGWDNPRRAFLVGAGHLGAALLGYAGFARHGLEIVAAFDNDPKRIGKPIAGKQVLPMEKLASLAERMNIRVAVIAVPAESAQQVADDLVAIGILGIWNFAPCPVNAPDHVVIQNEDLSAGLALLTSQVSRIIHPDKVDESDEALLASAKNL